MHDAIIARRFIGGLLWSWQIAHQGSATPFDCARPVPGAQPFREVPVLPVCVRLMNVIDKRNDE